MKNIYISQSIGNTTKKLWIFLILCLAFTSNTIAQGTAKWAYRVGNVNSDLRGCPAIASDGTIYVGSLNNSLYAINPDGTLKWEFETLGIAWHSPAIGADGTLYIGSGISATNYYEGNKKNFFAINPDGTVKWAVESSLVVDNSPAIAADGTIYLPCSDGLIAYKPDGTQKWKYADVLNSYATPAISSDGTIFLAGGYRLYAINADGTLKWTRELEGEHRASPAIGADGTLYIGSRDKFLYALNPADGSEKWKFAAGSMVLSSPIIDSDGTIYFGSYKGKFYAVNPDGTEKWFYQFSEDLGFIENDCAVIGDNNVIYFPASDPEYWFYKRVYALNTDGTLKWKYPTDLTVRTPAALASDGTIYVGATDGTLLALDGESSGVKTCPWPKFRGNAQNTGLGIDTLTYTSAIQSAYAPKLEVQCYPNPFVNNTTIKLTLKEKATVSVKIYTVIGTEVGTIFEGEKAAGKHNFVFEASSYKGQGAQQVYICKIQTEQKTQTKLLFQNK